METINFLVPRHRKMSEKEILILLEKYNLENKSMLPKIKLKDFAVREGDNIIVGDVVEISRTSFVGDSKYFRVVVE